ncbi:5'/3'-nucleotidase SurE [Bacteriovoracaceae bacterium]|nr:5'/3'-nucleotidase SurE [Bacteriovoracaceae bacterium]
MSSTKILFANDDGIYADGINQLYNHLNSISGYECYMVAPSEERSTTGHSLSLTSPLRVKKLNDFKYSCSGFPADCVLVGLGHVFKDVDFDLVISGINHGANLGQDLFYSGTIAAAREATYQGVPAIATSQILSSDVDADYLIGSKVIQFFLEQGVHKKIKPQNLLNINFPSVNNLSDIKGIKVTDIGYQKYTGDIITREDFRGQKYIWVGGHYKGFEEVPGTDCYESAQGYISLVLQNTFCHDNRELHHEMNSFVEQIESEFQKFKASS